MVNLLSVNLSEANYLCPNSEFNHCFEEFDKKKLKDLGKPYILRAINLI